MLPPVSYGPELGKRLREVRRIHHPHWSKQERGPVVVVGAELPYSRSKNMVLVPSYLFFANFFSRQAGEGGGDGCRAHFWFRNGNDL